MMTIDTRTRSVAAQLAQLRDIPTRIIPYATATALTRAAQAAQQDIRGAMLSVFSAPTAYTLGSTFVSPASKDKLSASVFVKNITTRGGTLPEDYLSPEVEGGQRKNKRFELALRYSGWLPAGWHAITTRAAASLLNESGDLPGATVRRILTAIGARQAKSKRAQAAAAKEFFCIAPDQARGRLRAGVYRHEGRKAIPIVRFTPVQPHYRPTLPFAQSARQAAERTFPREFSIALANMLQKGATQ